MTVNELIKKLQEEKMKCNQQVTVRFEFDSLQGGYFKDYEIVAVESCMDNTIQIQLGNEIPD